MIGILLAVSAVQSANAAHSTRAFPGPDGSLVYTSDVEGNRIPDFSVAGYRGGGVALPNVPVVANVAPVGGDNTAHLQAAIEAVELRAPDANGFRGALQLAPGDYPISGSLLIRASGVVLRGSGNGTNPAEDSILHRTGTDTSDVIKIGIGGTHGFSSELAGTRSDIVTDRVLVGDRSFAVADASGYAVGDNIVVYHPCTEAWLTAIDFGATGSDDPWSENSQPLVFSRNLTAIDGNRITMDAPVFNTLDRSLAQSYIFLADRSDILQEIGIENLRVTIDTNGETSEDHARSAIVFTETENCWVRDVVSEHFVYSGILFRTATRCTALNCEALEPHSVVTGGKRYNFNVEKSQLILFENCHASNARHAFTGNGTSRDNGIVFLDCVSSAAYTSSEGHRRWGMGFLYDGLTEINVRSSGLRLLGLYNRGSYGTGHGWSLAHSVAWNCDMGIGSASIQKPPTAQNYAIGCRGAISGSGPFSQPAGFIELTGRADLEPVSLYRQQLLDRQAEPIEVYLLIGQSNMSGRGRLASDPDSDAVHPDAAFTDERLQHWDHDLATWQAASDPLPQHDREVKPVAVGPGVSFGWGLLRLRSEDQRIGLIPAAHGGTSIQEWQKNPASDPDNLTLYADALDSVADALSGNARFGGIIWHQGESNLSFARDNPATYRALLHQLIQDLRTDIAALDPTIANPTDIPFVAGTLLDSKADDVDDILLTLSQEVANTDVARTTGLTAFDGTHFTAASQRLLGLRYAHRMARLQGSELPPIVFPNHLTLREGGNGTALQWIFHEAPASSVTLNWLGIESSGVSFHPSPPEYLPEDWPTPATILLRASDGAVVDPPIETMAMAGLASSDPLLDGVMLNPLRLTRLDNDSSTVAQLSPGDFTALGTINAGTSALSFDTDTLTVSGGLTGTGELIVTPSGAEVAVFTFSGIDLQTSPSVSGQRGLAILSQSDLTLGGGLSLNLNGGAGGHRVHGLGGPGGFDGGDSIRDAAEPGFTGVNGKGPGGSLGATSSSDRSGGGAGYGGVGGGGEAAGGMVAGDLQMSELLGGSGAGATYNKGGGGGGGALALGAVGDLAIEAGVVIQANGGAGAGSGSQLTSGGGSGGGILVFGKDVVIDGALRANGGAGGSASGAQANGGGGAGGRIAVYYQDELTASGGAIEVLGGQPVGANTIGQPGDVGTVFYSDLTPLMGPGDFAYALIEDFEALTLDAAVAGQGNWGGDSVSASEFSVRADPDNPLNQVLHFNQGVNKSVFVNSPVLQIPESAISTFFFRMRGFPAESGAADLWLRLSLSDAESPGGFNDGGTDLTFSDDGMGGLNFGDSGVLAKELWHGVWIVVDHVSDTYDAYIQPEGGHQVQVAANQAFRNGSATDAMVSFMIKVDDNAGAGSNGDAWFDDFHIAYGIDAHTITPADGSTVIPAMTTTMIDSVGPSPAGLGETVTVTASVIPTIPSGATVEGVVAFYNEAQAIGRGRLVAGIATLEIAALPVGEANLIAEYLGDDIHAASESAATALTVSGFKADTMTSLSTSLNPAPAGTLVTLTADVTPTGPAARGVLTTLPGWDGTTVASPMGEGMQAPGTMATFGQTFSVPAQSPVLREFSFWLSDSPDVHPDPLDFGGYLAEWDGDRIVGPIIHSASVRTTDRLSHGEFRRFDFPLNAELDPARTYVFFISASDYFDGVASEANLAVRIGSAYDGGHLVSASNQSDFGTLSTQGWSSAIAQDLVFEAKFEALLTGAVVFKDGGNVIGEESIDGQGQVAISTTGLPEGSRALTAHYSGDASFNASVSDPLVQVIQEVMYDFGDAPDDYPVAFVRDGARHRLSPLRLGQGFDLENDGQASSDASGDGVDDDGVAISTLLPGTGNTVVVMVSTDCRLDAWVDWNADGDWNDPGERVASSATLMAGPNEFVVNVPCDAIHGMTFARFRVSSSGGLSPAGEAADGEVEDYEVLVVDDSPPLIAGSGDLEVSTDPGMCGAVVQYSAAASDNCPGVTLTRETGLASGALFPKGETVVTHRAVDAVGNVSERSFKVTVLDTEAPSIAGPGDVTVSLGRDGCGATVNYAAPEAEDNCPGVRIDRTSGLASGASFPPGITLVTHNATDGSGNTRTHQFKVTVVDDRAPVITTPGDLVVDNDPGSCGAVVPYVVSVDDCSETTLARTDGLGSGARFPIGETMVTHRAEDSAGNVSEASFKVTVRDAEAPVVACRSFELLLNEDGVGMLKPEDIDAGTTDNCGGFTWELSRAEFDLVDLGDHSITLTATDDAGNQAMCIANVMVVQRIDYGDAPASYGTTLAANGARHLIGPEGPRFGALVDSDVDGFPDPEAMGDDGHGEDDEDGIPALELIAGETASIPLVVSGEPGKVDAWVDFNRNGVWESPSERVAVGVALDPGMGSVAISVPANASLGESFARFRISREGIDSPLGGAPDGEVEDVAVSIFAPADPPELFSPNAETTYRGSLVVQYELSGDPEPGSVELVFEGDSGRHVLRLKDSGAGQRILFGLDTGDPTSSPNVIEGSPVPDGIYSMTLTCRVVGAAARSSVTLTGVGLDSQTQPPVIHRPGARARFVDALDVSYTLPEDAEEGSATLKFDSAVSANDRTLVLGGDAATAGAKLLRLDPEDLSADERVLESVGGDVLPFGSYRLRLTYRDRAGNGEASVFVDVRRATNDPSLQSLATFPIGISPSFHPTILDYGVQLTYSRSKLRLAASSVDPLAQISIAGRPLEAGSAEAWIGVPVGESNVEVHVQSDGVDTANYRVRILREGPSPAAPASTEPLDCEKNGSVTIPGRRLLERDGDPANDLREIALVDSVSSVGGSLQLADGMVTYQAPVDFVGLDSFSYSYPDGMNGSAMARVEVRVSGLPGLKLDRAAVMKRPAGDDVDVAFAGLPGERYELQVSEDLKTWNVLQTLVAGPDGEVNYRDAAALAGKLKRFYRLVRMANPE